MPEENFLLVSLKEDKAKKLAQVISNDTSRLILDHLAKSKDSTVSDMAKALKLPMSTVHYNLQHLVEAKLVQAEEYHYSAKGKEVLHYSLTNKFVIIAPRDAPEGFVEKLKKLLPVTAVVLAGAGVVQLASRWLQPGADAIEQAAPMLAMKTMDAPLGAEMINETTEIAVDAFTPVQSIFQPNTAIWFLYGAVFTIIIFVIRDLILSRKK